MSELTNPTPFAPLPDDITSAPAAAEEETLRRWRASGTFESVQRSRASSKRFVFWEGPPTANGRPGIHHIFARTIKDTVCRYQTMQGKLVVRKAGWDTHGLPVELEVEKKLGINGKPEIEKHGVAAFNAQCRESVWTYRKEWEELSERIGYWLDYAHPYVTYDEEYVESVWYLLARFHEKGLIYRGKRVLPYCGRCGTGLSSHELGQPGVYRDLLDPSVIVRFRATDSKQIEPESFLAWTTTPWTLPSNVALAVHPEREYVLARIALPASKSAEKGSAGFELVWLAAERAQAVLGKEFEVREQAFGRELADRRYEALFAASAGVDPGVWKPHELDPYVRQVVLADYVTVEDGTGIVHQAPSYGVDDWDTARANRLPVLQMVGAEGKFVDDVRSAAERKPSVAKGTFFKDADDALMEDLKTRGLLFKKARESHSYPHCWRCDTPLFYFAAPAWYIRTTAYKQRMLEQNERIRWIPPEVGENRFGEWLENNVDWNISRDRYWGTPLPFWVCEAIVEAQVGTEACDHTLAVGSVEELRQRAGRLPPNFDCHKPSIDEIVFDCERCGGKGTLRRTKAVLDAWFDSGAMPYAQYHWPFGDGQAKVAEQFPADFIAEGLDQTRGWFYTLLAIGAFVTSLSDAGLPDAPAYTTCVVNGLLLDKDGVKMSKRLGNVVDPWKAIAEHGADAIRWYLLSSGAPWLPKRFDPSGILEVRRRFIGTLINSYKFFADYARLDAFRTDDSRIPSIAERSEIDRWILSRTQTLLFDVRSKMEDYDLAGVCKAIEGFVVDDLSNWYIRRNRRRFWKNETGADKLAAFATLHAALAGTALMIAPIAPFLGEMLWQRLMDGGGSVHAELLPAVDRTLIDRELEESMRIVTRIVEMGRALRERAGLKIRQPLCAIHVRSSHAESLELLRTPFAEHQILGELNIRSFGSLAADDGMLCSLKAKANFRVLGKRLGGLMKTAAEAIEILPATEVARLRGGEGVDLQLGAETIRLSPEDVQVTMQTRADFDIETDGRYVVYLDTELDEDLTAEGLAREAINRINGLRKDSGLAVEDRIRLRLHHGGDTALQRALDDYGRLIGEETLAQELEIDPHPFPGGTSAHFDLGEGRTLFSSFVRS